MAEALAGLAVAASVIAVVRTTEDVITKCSAYRIAYRNASKDMTRLSDQVSGLQGVLLDLHKLTVAEESQTFSRLPTLMTALEISHGDQTTGGIPEVRKSEDDARPGYGLTESMPSERTGLIKRLLKNFKRHGGKNMIDSQCERPDGIPSPNATTGDSLTAEGENTAGNASEIKDDHMNLPRVLRDCHVQLQSLSKKLETKIVRASRKEALVYAFKQGEVNKILDSLLKFQQQLVVALSIDQARLVLEVHDNQRRQDIYKWLAAPDYESKHLNAAGEWEEHTGSWFLQGESFQEWKSQPKSFLWLHGKAGAGKTILCSTIIREVSHQCISDPSLAVAFFYFDFRSKGIEPTSLLRALIKQLSLKSTKTPATTFNYLAQLFDKKNGQESPSLEELKSTLKSIIGTFQKNVYIIFDALDECPDRHPFLKLIKEIHGWNLDTLRLLATSRYEQDIEKTLRDLVSHQVFMDEGLVDSDIRVYVSRALTNDNKLSKYSAEKKEKIKTTLSDGAHGMFRWVVCQLDALRKCRSPHELKKALTSLPKTLYETYDRILLDIDEGNRDYALKLLQWLAFSVDKVSLREAVEVLATIPDGKNGPLFDPDRRFDDPRDILTLCSSLITITDLDELPYYYPGYFKDDQGKITELTLAHFSVREYLVSESLRTHRKLSFYHCDTKLANTFIAKTCLTYLLQFNQHSISRDIRMLHPLCSYAAKYWIRHTQPDNDDDPTLRRLITDHLQPESTVYSTWLELCYPHWYLRNRALIYYMSEAGLTIVSRELLENGADINAQGGEYGNALQAASFSGHQPTIELLLEKGADVNAQGGNYGNALQAALSQGHHTIMQLLLEKGADVNVQGGEYGNALQAASFSGHHPTNELLLEKGADVNVQGGRYGNALQAASFSGHHPIVQLLLEKGADVNVEGGQYGNALQAASSKGHHATIKLLLEKGADINGQGGLYGSALQGASSRGHRAIVELLLEKGAEVNVQGGRHGNALQAASVIGHHPICELLLEEGADVNAQGGQYCNALQAALSRGHHAIVQLLLGKGAGINAQGGEYGNALQAASSRGHHSIAQLLLEKGADINVQGGQYGNVLQVASLRGHHAIVQLLLEKGADINSQDGQYGNALQAASSGGHHAIVQLLLERGADVNAQGGQYGNALQSASSRDHHSIAQLLLEKGADVNVQGGRYGNALEAASSMGHHAIIQLFLDKGADVNVQGGWYGNALQAASSMGHHSIVQLLLDKGADVNAQGGQYGNALQAASSRDHHAIVQLLLEKGADVNAQGGQYGNALQVASLQGHHAIVQLLLEKGADINMQSGRYGNALQAASSRDHHAIVQLLLEKGADVNVQGGEYGNVL